MPGGGTANAAANAFTGAVNGLKTLCVDTLAAGSVQAFVELFYVANQPIVLTEVRLHAQRDNATPSPIYREGARRKLSLQHPPVAVSRHPFRNRPLPYPQAQAAGSEPLPPPRQASSLEPLRALLVASEDARRAGDTPAAIAAYTAAAAACSPGAPPQLGYYYLERCLAIAKLAGDTGAEMGALHALGLAAEAAGDTGEGAWAPPFVLPAHAGPNPARVPVLFFPPSPHF